MKPEHILEFEKVLSCELIRDDESGNWMYGNCSIADIAIWQCHQLGWLAMLASKVRRITDERQHRCDDYEHTQPQGRHTP